VLSKIKFISSRNHSYLDIVHFMRQHCNINILTPEIIKSFAHLLYDRFKYNHLYVHFLGATTFPPLFKPLIFDQSSYMSAYQNNKLKTNLFGSKLYLNEIILITEDHITFKETCLTKINLMLSS
jgi:hypothetical protein